MTEYRGSPPYAHFGTWKKPCHMKFMLVVLKVIREKSRGEGSLIGQDTIENVSEPKFFFNFFKEKKCFS